MTLYVASVGPFPMAEGDVFGYVMGDDDLHRHHIAVAVEAETLDLLAELATAAGPGERLCCREPRLAAAAAGLGWELGPVPEALARSAAILAWQLRLTPMVSFEHDTVVLHALAGAAAELWAADLLHWRERHRPIIGAISSGLGDVENPEDVFEGQLVVEDGEFAGLALYPEFETVRQLEELRGRDTGALATNGLLLTFSHEPDVVRREFEAAYGLPRVPIPYRLRDDEQCPASERDLTVLAAAALAIRALPGAKHGHGCRLPFGGGVAVHVIHGPPAKA